MSMRAGSPVRGRYRPPRMPFRDNFRVADDTPKASYFAQRSAPLLTERSSYRLLSETDMSKPNDLVQGTLDLLLLKILALEPLHGWAISLRLKSISGNVLQVSEGSLYPALHKLEQEGWIAAEWKQTENNRRPSRTLSSFQRLRRELCE